MEVASSDMGFTTSFSWYRVRTDCRSGARLACGEVSGNHPISVIESARGATSSVVTSSRQVAGGRAARPRWYLPIRPR